MPGATWAPLLSFWFQKVVKTAPAFTFTMIWMQNGLKTAAPWAVRTWKDHIRVLKRLGFILVASDGNREFGHILLLNPLAVAARLHTEGKTPSQWWPTFKRRAVEIGAKIPAASILPAIMPE